MTPIPSPPANDIPETFHVSFLALLPTRSSEIRDVFVREARELRPRLAKDPLWVSRESPRNVSFGYVRDGDWTWLVSHDAHPVPETAWRTTFHAGPSAPAHLSAVNVYLVQQPAGATPLEQVRSTLDLAWAWQRAGATALVWPEPRMVLEGAKLARTCARRPSQLTTAELAWLLVAFTDFGVESGSRRLGTMGLTQFDQPELCCEVSDPPTEEERMAVVQFLAAAVPNVIDLGRPLEAGERIAVAGHRCVAGARTGLVQVITPFGR